VERRERNKDRTTLQCFGRFLLVENVGIKERLSCSRQWLALPFVLWTEMEGSSQTPLIPHSDTIKQDDWFWNYSGDTVLHCLLLLTARKKKLHPSGAEVWNRSSGLQHFFSVTGETTWLYRLDWANSVKQDTHLNAVSEG